MHPADIYRSLRLWYGIRSSELVRSLIALTEIVPFPFAVPNATAPSSLTEEDAKIGRHLLRSLDEDVSDAQNTSARLQKSLRDLRRLLDGQEFTPL